MVRIVTTEIADKLRASVSPRSHIYSRLGVMPSREFDRIVALPRRKWEGLATEEALRLTTDYFKTPQGTQKLFAVQAVGLLEAHDCAGAFIQAGVGSGKTLLSLLLPTAMNAVRPLLIVPAGLRDRTIKENIPEYGKHWRLHPGLQVISYDFLSRDSGSDFLEKYAPDLIICDEGHRFRHATSARTRRFQRYLRAHVGTRLVVMTGTAMRKSIKDFAHLMRFALRENCPLPIDWKELQDWAAALDEDMPDDKRMEPGVLEDFAEAGESIAEGVQRRMRDTPGVVFTSTGTCDASLVFTQVDVKVPDEVHYALAELYATELTPNGDVCTCSLDVWRAARELSSGFYLRWRWPLGPDGKEQKHLKWLLARKMWRTYVKDVLKLGRAGLDSEFQVARACTLGKLPADLYKAWLAIRDEYEIDSLMTWISPFLVEDVAARILKSKTPSLIWVAQPQFGARLAELSGAPYVGAGTTERDILRHEGKHVILSIDVCKEGRNLQAWQNNIVVQAPTSASDWEQLLGRTHRTGQEADEIRVEIYAHTMAMRAGFAAALREARGVQATLGQKQKLLYSDMTFSVDGWARE